MKYDNIRSMHTALNAYSLRNETINNNLANVNTPNYKRETVKFEEFLKNSQKFVIKGATTDAKHIDIPGNSNNQSASIIKDTAHSKRIDGNNVSADVEAAEQVKNSINYNAVVQRLSGNFQTLKSAIRGGN